MSFQIHFFTGKGGVGKSLLAAAFAQRQVAQNQRTLLVELGTKSHFERLLKTNPVTYSGLPLSESLSLALWDGPSCLKEYALHLLKFETIYKLFMENPISKSLIEVAPALSELAILGKITSHPRKHGPPLDFDALIIDGFSTGHFLNLLRGPVGMSRAISRGPMYEQSKSILKVLQDPRICFFHIVSLPEPLPTEETIELCQTLTKEFEIIPNVYLNKALPFECSQEQIKLLKTQVEKSEWVSMVSEAEVQISNLNQSLERFHKYSYKVNSVPYISEIDTSKQIELLKDYL